MTTIPVSLLCVAALGTALGFAFPAQAQLEGNLLLRQGSFTNVSYMNQWYGDLPGVATAMGAMITTTQTWDISNIQILQNGDQRPGFRNTWFGNVHQGFLNVSRQVNGAPDPSIDPTTNTNVDNPNSVLSSVVLVTLDLPTSNANGANQSFRMTTTSPAGAPQLRRLPPGDYVISFIAIADRHGQFRRGDTLASTATAIGQTPDYIRNPGGYATLPSGTAWGTLRQNFINTGAVENMQWAIGINGAIVQPACLADFNNAAGITVEDIFDFLSAWFNGDNRADFNNAGGLTTQDIFDFLNAWFAGCP